MKALALAFSLIAAVGEPPNLLVSGRFGAALDASARPADWFLEAAGRDQYRRPPFTVECWARLRSKQGYNILVANEPKYGSAHWELYTAAGSGALSFYMPAATPSDIRSNIDVADGRWRHFAATVEPGRVRLYVDGQIVADAAVALPATAAGEPLPLTVGYVTDAHEGHGCDGDIDEVRISQGARPIAAAESLSRDRATIALWKFDALDQGHIEDETEAANHLRLLSLHGQSLDEVERQQFGGQGSPLAGDALELALTPGRAPHAPAVASASLDGSWELSADESFAEPIPATVPGSVHAALVEAGRLPDPVIGKNQLIVKEASYRPWWMRRTFPRPALRGPVRLQFDGICSQCEIWLNGELLDRRIGMFGRPSYDVSDRLRDENTLVVKLEPAGDWKDDVVFNNVYGWHYCQIPSRGVWRSVRLMETPTVDLGWPFLATIDAPRGKLRLAVELQGPEDDWSGPLAVTIEPENFRGEPVHLVTQVAGRGAQRALLEFAVPDPQLWWPNGLGAQPLYRATISFAPERGRSDARSFTFGIRTIEMAPTPGGPRRDRYDWTFVINGHPTFIKGAGWCTMDPLMDFSRQRYDRFLSLAKNQHLQMLRPWGSGMPETDDFYDLCDRKGILVMQEWPTAWNSHLVQPAEALEETVRLDTIRLRNRPSLALYTGGNESAAPFGPAIDMMGRLAAELDGSRAFHRQDPWGGSRHDYTVYWGRAPLDHNVAMEATFFGEFGLASMPAAESIRRYLPEEERQLWPAPDDGSLWHHTPIFNTAKDREILTHYSSLFTSGETMESFVVGSQLAQAVGLRHTLERARTRWPQCTGALFYKLNDNYPAASWSMADWYGAPKIAYYTVMDAFAPLHACVVFERLNSAGNELRLPVWLLDDNGALDGASWEVVVRAFDGTLRELKRQAFAGSGAIAGPRRLGEFHLAAEQNAGSPLLTVVEVRRAGKLAHRTFYWTNYEQAPDCLLRLPATELTLRPTGDAQVAVRNTGDVPAVGVHFRCADDEDRDNLLADDGYFWLEAGEERIVNVNRPRGVAAAAWNARASYELRGASCEARGASENRGTLISADQR